MEPQQQSKIPKHFEGACAIVCQLADPVQHKIHNLLPDGVVPPAKIKAIRDIGRGGSGGRSSDAGGGGT